jgi:hypothetical protein
MERIAVVLSVAGAVAETEAPPRSLGFHSNGIHFAAAFEKEFSMNGGSRTRDVDSRVRGELVDSFDEELEMEIDDDRLKQLIAEFADRPIGSRRPIHLLQGAVPVAGGAREVAGLGRRSETY